MKKWGIIQDGYRKLGTHARVFPQTLAHGNSKSEIRQKKTGVERKMKCVIMERRTEMLKKKKFRWLNMQLKHNNNKRVLLVFHKIRKKLNEIQFD